jgi:carbamoyl-phosphate synthase small subunit
MRAKVALEDGRVFEGVSFGVSGEKHGEVVFNTSMTGYQEILTDPSYKGQIVTMTYPLIGNYGVNPEDVESGKIFLEGFIVKEISRVRSNWRSTGTLDKYLKKNNIMGIEGVDTRALTRHIRLRGAMKGVISTTDLDDKSLVNKANRSGGLLGLDLVKDVTCGKAYRVGGIPGLSTGSKRNNKVIAMDFGIKYNILRCLAKAGCDITVVPAATKAEEILKQNPAGVLLSNGPGDPSAVTYAIGEIKKLLGKVPVFGICLGQQLLCLALGGRTYKLKFGHHGGNHPVKDLRTGRISITSQNHGFCVDAGSLDKNEIEVTHINLNDNTLEGIRHRKLPAFSVQFHPEHGPGPHDAEYLFKEFSEMIKKHAKKN